MKKFKKFLINKSSIILGLILGIIFLVIFIICLLLTELLNLEHEVFVCLSILKEISIIGFTVFTSTLITALFIEVKNKNNEYISTIANEVITDPSIVHILKEEPKMNLWKHLADDSEIKQDMFDSFIKNIKNEKYYFECCDIDVRCKIEKNRIEKTIVRNMSICSFEKNIKLQNFKILGVVGEEDYNDPNSKNKIIISRISVGNITLKPNEYQIQCEKVENSNADLKRNNYLYRLQCIIPEITLKSNEPVVICAEYSSIVGIDDLVYVSRATAPCKKYAISFALENKTKDNYVINGSAFGFMDNNMGNKHNNSSLSYNAYFDHWVYKHDGVSIYIIKK